ncbi:hypothetical protein WJX72_005326 [[Myrmecia] bisecta]|uniref:Phenazine biosynthesis-like protein n=1 Tax=[Myrmecia] bisecta TaxID=41462 RepID=A0AAW1Q146_9CHLO
MELKVPLYQVDAFTKQAFKGNPAAVCLLGDTVLPLDDSIRQAIAAEMNLSETAFLEVIQEEGQGMTFSTSRRFKLRWFTPTVEMPLCGHATLASAAALIEGEGNKAGQLFFETASGTLSVTQLGAADDGRPMLQMALPLADPVDPVPQSCLAGSALMQVLLGGQQPADVCFSQRLKYLLVVLPEGSTKEDLLALQPDPRGLLEAASTDDVTGVIVSLPGGSGDGSGQYDVLSRFFAPWSGIDEDAVTGSAHSLLAPYWGARLNKTSLTARQCSSRGGELIMQVDAANQRVLVGGTAVIVTAGKLYL